MSQRGNENSILNGNWAAGGINKQVQISPSSGLTASSAPGTFWCQEDPSPQIPSMGGFQQLPDLSEEMKFLMFGHKSQNKPHFNSVPISCPACSFSCTSLCERSFCSTDEEWRHEGLGFRNVSACSEGTRGTALR